MKRFLLGDIPVGFIFLEIDEAHIVVKWLMCSL